MQAYLFPDFSLDTDDPVIPQVPVMHSVTRQKLYSIINLLCKRSDVNMIQTMGILVDIVPRGQFLFLPDTKTLLMPNY